MSSGMVLAGLVILAVVLINVFGYWGLLVWAIGSNLALFLGLFLAFVEDEAEKRRKERGRHPNTH